MVETPEYLYQEIAEAFRRRIASGELGPGDRLPPVRDLARSWTCTPGTVNRAYHILSAEGLVVSHRGRGTRVAENVFENLSARQPGTSDQAQLGWASLVNRAEQYLLEGKGQGYSAGETQAALTVAISRWRALRDLESTDEIKEEQGSLLHFSGSHDLVVENLAAVLKEQTPAVEMQLSFSGSLGGLMALLRGEADLAGVHLWDEETDSYNEPFVRRLLPAGGVVMVTLVQRRLGLMFNRRWAHEIRSLADVSRHSVRMVNRQRGSGTRLWLDAQFRQLKIDTATIEGYKSELTTHVAVAQRVADRKADVGPGIHAAAAAYGLDFLPLANERYDLVVLSGIWESRPVQALVNVVTSQSFQKSVEAMGGYDSRESGRIWRV